MPPPHTLSPAELGHRLHEGACQTLLAASLQATVLERQLAGGSGDEVAQIVKLRETLDRLSGELSSLLREMRAAAGHSA